MAEPKPEPESPPPEPPPEVPAPYGTTEIEEGDSTSDRVPAPYDTAPVDAGRDEPQHRFRS